MEWNSVQTVLVPVDLEEATGQAIRTALQAAASPGGVHVVYVLPELEPSLMVQIDVNSRKNHALRSLDKWLEEQGASGVASEVLVGKPARAIVDRAHELNADLVVLESRPHNAVSRALIGSVAERVVRHAVCPVLMLRMPEA